MVAISKRGSLQVSAHDILQYRTLPARLRSHHSDLRKVYGVLYLGRFVRYKSGKASPRESTYSYCCKDILELVDESDQARIIHIDATALGSANWDLKG